MLVSMVLLTGVSVLKLKFIYTSDGVAEKGECSGRKFRKREFLTCQS